MRTWQTVALLIIGIGHSASPSFGKTRTLRSTAAADCGVPLPFVPLRDPNLELIFTPPDSVAGIGKSDPDTEGHARWISAIEGAHDSVNMTMFHLTDRAVINALVDAAGIIAKNHPGASADDLSSGVHLILDHDFYQDKKNAPIIAKLQAGGVLVRPSSDTFRITHVKAMVLDEKTAFVTAMNMTKNESWTRDFGVITHDTGVIREMGTVFQSDWQNYTREKPAKPITPLVTEDSLVWSPVNSERKLVELIKSARSGTQLLCSTESLTDKAVEEALVRASKCGVQVIFLAPQCDINPDPELNLSSAAALNMAAGKTIAFVEPGTGSAAVPYIHSKMCLANFDPATGGGTAYVGSVNLSTDSMRSARELGIVFQNDAANSVLNSLFHKDLALAVSPTAPNQCPPPAAVTALPEKSETADPDQCAPGEICGSVEAKKDGGNHREPAESVGPGEGSAPAR